MCALSTSLGAQNPSHTPSSLHSTPGMGLSTKAGLLRKKLFIYCELKLFLHYELKLFHWELSPALTWLTTAQQRLQNWDGLWGTSCLTLIQWHLCPCINLLTILTPIFLQFFKLNSQEVFQTSAAPLPPLLLPNLPPLCVWGGFQPPLLQPNSELTRAQIHCKCVN